MLAPALPARSTTTWEWQLGCVTWAHHSSLRASVSPSVEGSKNTDLAGVSCGSCRAHLQHHPPGVAVNCVLSPLESSFWAETAPFPSLHTGDACLPQHTASSEKLQGNCNELNLVLLASQLCGSFLSSSSCVQGKTGLELRLPHVLPGISGTVPNSSEAWGVEG